MALNQDTRNDRLREALKALRSNLLTPLPPKPAEEAWSNNLDEYVYEQLSSEPRETRIISILPPSDDDSSIIRCTLSKLPLAPDSTVEYDYTALSYTWGDSKERFPILLNDKKFYVARNLLEFLEHIRDEKKTLEYWIDAVCINQKDVDERNRHVKFMKDIYEKAKAVTVWLGIKADNSGLAIKTIQAMRLVADTRAKAQLWQAMPFFLQSLPFVPQYPQLLRIGEDQTKLLCSALLVAAPAYASPNKEFAEMAAEALRKLFDRPWWQRVWIVQEVTVPNKDIFVMCGKDSVAWKSCQEASDLYGSFHRYALSDLTLATSFSVPFYNIDRLLRIQRARRDATGPTRMQRLSLSTLCKNYMHFGATNNRDRVYALLGLAEDIDLATYTVDYEQSTISTYLYMTRYLIEKHQNLDIFGFCCYPSWISWCPHWVWRYIPTDPFHKLVFKQYNVDAVHKTRDGRYLYTYQSLFNAHDGSKIPPDHFGRTGWGRVEDIQPTPAYCASKGAKPAIHFHGDRYDVSDPPRIILQGFVFDVVTGQPLPATPPSTPVTEVERTVWEPAVLASCETYITGEPMLTAFRRTIRADIAMQDDGMPRRGASVIWGLNEIEVDEDTDDGGDYELSVAEYYLQHSLHNCRATTRGRSLFRTEKGYMGLAPDQVEEGDLICVLFGGQLAYCLRRTEDESETYSLIGESYLHGIMDGEAMVDFAAGKYQETEFMLK